MKGKLDVQHSQNNACFLLVIVMYNAVHSTCHKFFEWEHCRHTMMANCPQGNFASSLGPGSILKATCVCFEANAIPELAEIVQNFVVPPLHAPQPVRHTSLPFKQPGP